MKTLAIVCSYNEACGNASYAHVLKKAFSEHVQCDVIPLDLFVLQNPGPRFAAMGDQHIRSVAERLKGYDYVNIQHESGLYGRNLKASLRRVKILIDACSNLILTLHRLDPPYYTQYGIAKALVEDVVTGRPISGINRFLRDRRSAALADHYGKLIKHCAARARRSNIWIAVHTKREYRLVRDLYGFENVFDHPLAFLLDHERQAVLNSNDYFGFRNRHKIPSGVKIIGTFGFLGGYKGYETALNALKLLPENYHLYIFGSQHPQSIRPNVAVDPYLRKLMTVMRDQGVAGRVRFVGELSDPEFIEALRFSEAVVLPYLEVGQSMSAVLALAIECDANLFCANNLSFNEVRKYYGDVYHRFDIGNHIELAQKITVADTHYRVARDLAYGKYNIRSSARLHLEKLGFEQARAS
jgi:glycosyltransferase involved in cell wall biosynthesis